MGTGRVGAMPGHCARGTRRVGHAPGAGAARAPRQGGLVPGRVCAHWGGSGQGGHAGGGRDRGEGGERKLTTGSMDGNNCSPGSTLGQGERWREVEEGEIGYFARERENEGEGHAWVAGAPGPRRVPDRLPSTLISPASK
jgi:hypothetical protein